MGEVMLVLDGGDTISMSDIQAYQEVIAKAFAVHLDREARRHGLWKEYPADKQYDQVKIKVDRIIRSLELMGTAPHEDDPLVQLHVANILEETYDIINYAIFGARQLVS